MINGPAENTKRKHRTLTLEEARRAYEDVAPETVGDTLLADPEVIEDLRTSADALIEIARQIERYLHHLQKIDRAGCDLDVRFRADMKIFREQFHLIYGNHLDDDHLPDSLPGSFASGGADVSGTH